jgi:hypothetical protein
LVKRDGRIGRQSSQTACVVQPVAEPPALKTLGAILSPFTSKPTTLLAGRLASATSRTATESPAVPLELVTS